MKILRKLFMNELDYNLTLSNFIRNWEKERQKYMNGIVPLEQIDKFIRIYSKVLLGKIDIVNFIKLQKFGITLRELEERIK